MAAGDCKKILTDAIAREEKASVHAVRLSDRLKAGERVEYLRDLLKEAK